MLIINNLQKINPSHVTAQPVTTCNISNNPNGFEPSSLGRFGAFPKSGSGVSRLIFFHRAGTALPLSPFPSKKRKACLGVFDRV